VLHDFSTIVDKPALLFLQYAFLLACRGLSWQCSIIKEKRFGFSFQTPSQCTWKDAMVALLPRPTNASAEEGLPLERLPENLRRIRRERHLTMDALSFRCGVSRAMISKIERGDSVPTATVLGKLAAGLEIGLSHLLGGAKIRAPLLLQPGDQPVFRDPESGLERRSLSPLFSDRMVDFALNTLPARSSVSFPSHHHGVEEYLYVSRGALIVVVGEERFTVRQGSSLFYHAHVVHEFHNETDQAAEFFIVVDSTGTR